MDCAKGFRKMERSEVNTFIRTYKSKSEAAATTFCGLRYPEQSVRFSAELALSIAVHLGSCSGVVSL
jgi:hypothetical protein